MLNCTVTYRSQDKKPDGNKMNAIGFTDNNERSGAFEKVTTMSNAFKATGTSALKDEAVRVLPAFAKIAADYTKFTGKRLPLCAVTRIETAD